MKAVATEQIRQLDQRTIAAGTPGASLPATAAGSVARVMDTWTRPAGSASRSARSTSRVFWATRCSSESMRRWFSSRRSPSRRDIRFTAKGDVLYAILLAWPGEEAVVRSLSPDLRLYAGEVGGVELLGSNEKPVWTRDEGGLKVRMPARKPCDCAFVLKIMRKVESAKK